MMKAIRKGTNYARTTGNKKLKQAALCMCVFSGFCLFKKKHQHSDNEILKVGCAGALSQMVSELTLHCIDTVNVRCKGVKGSIRWYQMVEQIVTKEGWGKFFVAINATFYASLFGGFIYFSLYKLMKSRLKTGKESGESFSSFPRYFMSAITAEMAALTVYFPFELIKTRLQTSNNVYKYASLLDAFRKIINTSFDPRTWDPKALYSGSLPYFAMFTLYTTVQFSCYEEIMKLQKRNGNGSSEYSHLFKASILSGAIASLASNWLEVLTVKKQINPNALILDIFKEERFRILVKGITPRLLFNMFQSVIIFTLLDRLCHSYGVEFDD